MINNLNQINFSKIYSLNEERKNEDVKEENSSSYSNKYQNLKNSNTNNYTFKKKLKNCFMSEIKEEVKQRVFLYQLPGLNQYNHYFNTEFLEEKRNEIILYALL